MLPISVIIISNNERSNVERCLNSVHGWVQEIIIVFNDCSDQTDVIARETFEAKVFYHSWQGHRDQKNIALGYAQSDWVLSLDMDEAVSNELKASIFNFFENKQYETIKGAYFARKVWFLGRWITHGDWYPDHSLRLFKRSCAHFGGCMEHDTVIVQGNQIKLKGDLYHFSFQSLHIQLTKTGTFGSSFLKRQLSEGKRWNSYTVVFRTVWKFFRAYILRRGFLDGFPGLYIAYMQSFSTLFRYSLLYERTHPCTPPRNLDLGNVHNN